MVSNTRIQRVTQAVRQRRVSVRLVLVFAAALVSSLYALGRAWVMWGYDVYTRQDKVSGAMLIFTMGAVIAIIGVLVWMRSSKDR